MRAVTDTRGHIGALKSQTSANLRRWQFCSRDVANIVHTAPQHSGDILDNEEVRTEAAG